MWIQVFLFCEDLRRRNATEFQQGFEETSVPDQEKDGFTFQN